MPLSRGSARLWWVAYLGLSACGGGGGGDTVPDRDLPDTGAIPTEDGSVTPGDLDAGSDASVETDAGTDADAGDAFDGSSEEDAGPPEIVDIGPCSLDQSSVLRVEETGIYAEQPIAVSMRNEGGALAWVGLAQGGKRVVRQRWYPLYDVYGTEPDPFAMLSNQTEPSSAATASGHLTVWVDDFDARPDVRLARMSADGVRTEATVDWLTRDEATETAPVVAAGAEGRALVVWQSKAGDDAPVGRAQLLDVSGRPSGSVLTLPGYGAMIGRPALARLGAGYVLAWTDATTAAHVHLQRLDATGAPIGSPVQVDKSGNAQGHVDLATGTTGGAVVFDVRIAGERGEARIRTFDTAGAWRGAETVVGSTDTGLWPSVVALNGGFVVAYRSATADGNALRVALHGSRGSHLGATTVRTIDNDNLPTVLRISPDAKRLMLAWLDRVSHTNAFELHRAWVRCD